MVNCRVCPWSTLAVAGLTLTDVGAGGGSIGMVTVTIAVPEIAVPAAVALTVTVPVAAGDSVRRPVALMVPAVAGSIDHVTAWDTPAGSTVAVNCRV